jgi:hypothetical protein
MKAPRPTETLEATAEIASNLALPWAQRALNGVFVLFIVLRSPCYWLEWTSQCKPRGDAYKVPHIMSVRRSFRNSPRPQNRRVLTSDLGHLKQRQCVSSLILMQSCFVFYVYLVWLLPEGDSQRTEIYRRCNVLNVKCVHRNIVHFIGCYVIDF